MDTMTGKERLLAAFRREPVDHVPCSPRIHAWLMEQYGDGKIERYLQLAERFPAFDPHLPVGPFILPSELSYRESYDLPDVAYRFEKHLADDGFTEVRRWFDTPKGELTDVTRIPPAGDRRFGISPNPVRSEHLVKSNADVDRLRYLIADKSRADLSAYHDAAALFGERGLVEVCILSALCHRAGDVLGMEDLMVAYYDDRGLFDALLGMYQDEMMAEVRRCLDDGIRHFFANWYYNSMSSGWSPAIWEEVFAPQLKEMTEAVHAAGGTVNLYDDGICMPILDLLAACEIDVLQTLTPPPVGDVDLADAKRRIGDRVCLMGHVDLLYVIQRGTPGQIREAVREAVEVAAPGGGFILGTSDSIRDGTPEANVEAYFSAAAEFGTCNAAMTM